MIIDFIKKKIRTLHEIRAQPEAVAGGVAIGMFLGFTPLFGLKTLLALVIAWLARCSKMAAIIAVTLHDVLAPIAPFVVFVEYALGHAILGLPGQPPSEPQRLTILQRLHEWPQIFHAHFFWNFLYPTLIGSFVIGFPIAIISYIVTHIAIVKVQQRRALAEAAAAKAGEKSDQNEKTTSS